MDLAEHLLRSRTPMELAKELAAKTKEAAALKDQVSRLEQEVFWQTASSARIEEMQQASRYRWARLPENGNLMHCLIMQSQFGSSLDKSIDIYRRSAMRTRCRTCNGEGIILQESEHRWMHDNVWCPDCDGTGVKEEKK